MNAVQLALVNDHTQTDPQDYLLSIEETVPVHISTFLDEWLHDRRHINKTPDDMRVAHGWSTTGIEPEINYTWDDILSRIEQDPDKQFSLHGCSIPLSSVWVFPKFNRMPEPTQCQNNLNTNPLGKGLSYQALGSPQFFLVKIDGETVCMSVSGGHRSIMSILQFGYDGFIPGANVIYVGSLELEAPMPLASATHHQDCSKRNNQNANQRMISGVESNDKKFVEQFQWLMARNLFFDKTKMPSKITSNMREISSYSSLMQARKNVKQDSSWDTVLGWFFDEVAVGEKIEVSSLEPVTIVWDTFGDVIERKSIPAGRIKRVPDLFEKYVRGLLQFSGQKHFRVHTKSKKYTAHQNAWKIIQDFNVWCKNSQGFNRNIITKLEIEPTDFMEFISD